MLQCPVCGKGLSLELEQCPQCHADLGCFKLLDELLEPLAENVGDKLDNAKQDDKNIRLNKRWLFVILLTVLLFIMQTVYLQQTIDNSKIQNNVLNEEGIKKTTVIKSMEQRQLTDISNKLIKLEKSLLIAKKETQVLPKQIVVQPVENISALNCQLSEKTKKNETLIIDDNSFAYQSNENETLWSISKKFYVHGKYYPVILKENPGLTIYNHLSYGKILINPNQHQIRKLYQQITNTAHE